MEIANAFQRRGLLFVLSSPSGAGKSTIARMLLECDNGIAMSVSATTRPKRAGEVEGPRLSFRHDDEFDRMLATGAVLEWAHVFGYRYGTLRNEVLKVIEEGATSCSTSTGRGRSSSSRSIRTSSASSSSRPPCRSWSGGCAPAAPIART
jgi:guanylate kinase